MAGNRTEQEKISHNPTKVGCLGQICSKRNKIIQVAPTYTPSDDDTSPKFNAPVNKPLNTGQTNHLTSATFKVSKNSVSVTIFHTPLTDPSRTSPTTKRVMKQRSIDVTSRVNRNNNNEDNGKDRKKNDLERKERTDGGCISVSQSEEESPSSSTEWGIASPNPGQVMSSKKNRMSGTLPTLQTTCNVFNRQRRDQEEILRELQNEGIVSNPRITIGGVSYGFPGMRRSERPAPPIHLSTSFTTPMRSEKDKEKRRELDHRLKMCKAKERRGFAEIKRIERLKENQDKYCQVRDKMEYDEDLKMRQTHINLITKLSTIVTNRDKIDWERRRRSELRNMQHERVRKKSRKMKDRGKRDKVSRKSRVCRDY